MNLSSSAINSQMLLCSQKAGVKAFWYTNVINIRLRSFVSKSYEGTQSRKFCLHNNCRIIVTVAHFNRQAKSCVNLIKVGLNCYKCTQD